MAESDPVMASIEGIVAWMRKHGGAHPHSACVAKFGDAAMCAKAKDIMTGTTKWRGPAKESSAAGEAIDPIKATSPRPLLFSPAQEWIAFLPKPGRYPHALYGEMDLTDERLDRIVSNFAADTYKQAIPINAEHDSRASGAVGYITAMRRAADGSIEVKAEWNERGRALIDGDRFRYVSAEFFDDWQDPVTGEWHEDVACGLAICTRPHFKADVLRPLAASEAEAMAMRTETDATTPPPIPSNESAPESGLTDEAGDTGTEEDMAEDKADVQEPVTEPAVVAEKTTDPVIRQLDEAAAMEFAELRRNAKRLEEENKQLSADRSRLMAESRVKRFTAEVRGASEHNGTAYIGDIQEHVQMLCDLEESFGPNSQQVRFYMEQNRAHAEQMVKSTLFSEMGTGRGAESDTKTYDQIEAQAREIARTSGKSHAQAFNEVLETNPELRSALARERRGGR